MCIACFAALIFGSVVNNSDDAMHYIIGMHALMCHSMWRQNAATSARAIWDAPGQLGGHDAGVQGVGVHLRAGWQPPCQLKREHHVGKLALAIRKPVVVLALQVWIVHINVSKLVRLR